MFGAQKTMPVTAERLIRPQRIGLFGPPGVGKTTLLTVLYREAVGGRLPGLRLAAADVRTANYLTDKIGELESGRPLPPTLSETDLRFHLYTQDIRLELFFKDYQGQDVELDRDESIRDFFRDCDAVWLCLDAGDLTSSSECLRRQQEIERLVEDCLAGERRAVLTRPVALLLTKADLIESGPAPSEAWFEFLGMTRHALQTHCPNSGLFAVSSLGKKQDAKPQAISTLHDLADSHPPRAGGLLPMHLAEPLQWLAGALQTQDEARLEELFTEESDRPSLLGRCLECFARCYPDAPAVARFRQSLAELRRNRRKRRGLAGALAAACFTIGLWTYDAAGYHNARRFEADHADDTGAVLQQWRQYQVWHPTRNLLRPEAARQEQARLEELQQKARGQQRAQRLTDLQQQIADSEFDGEALWPQFRKLVADFPESNSHEIEPLRLALASRRDEQIGRRALAAFDELVSSEARSGDLQALIAQADRFLSDYPGSAQEPEVRRRRAAYVLRLDERDLEPARAYSAKSPLEFPARREHYQHYLDRHPGGAFAPEADAALAAIDLDWDRHEFRQLRDLFEARPGDIGELVQRCREYQVRHPQGRSSSAVADLLRWTEQVTAPREYRVVVRSGEFESGQARWLSRGLKLSVELEVNGVPYGPSTIVKNSNAPEWNYEFPRYVRWKLGDSVRIRVTDHTWKDRVLFEVASADVDPLGMKLFTGDVWHGKNRLTFETDFALPVLPAVE